VSHRAKIRLRSIRLVDVLVFNLTFRAVQASVGNVSSVARPVVSLEPVVHANPRRRAWSRESSRIWLRPAPALDERLDVVDAEPD
jgi:hypothetical protein